MTLAIRKAALIALACGLLAGLAGCGGETVPDTATETSASAAAPGTTPATSAADAAAAEELRVMSEYTGALRAWADDFTSTARMGAGAALEFVDPAQPTDDELAQAREFTEVLRSSVARLEKISAPAEVSRAHSQLCTALRKELNALDRFISAVGWKSERDAELAYREAEEAFQLFIQAAGDLNPFVDLSDVTQS